VFSSLFSLVSCRIQNVRVWLIWNLRRWHRSTPNSTTTSLSGVSTTAIKDGHQGNIRPHTHRGHRSSTASNASTTTLDAERADRISRLAGLERVSTVRPDGTTQMNASSGAQYASGGYFETLPHLLKERSTVGSASATGSAGGRTTWTGSDAFDMDRMVDDADDGTSSNGGFSDENVSLVGFGEGANSTVSGPVSTAPTRTGAGLSRQTSATAAAAAGGSPSAHRLSSHSMPSAGAPPLSGEDDPGLTTPVGSNTPEAIGGSVARNDDARMVDGMTFDPNVIDTTDRPAPPVSR
jgi:hypothetical protein